MVTTEKLLTEANNRLKRMHVPLKIELRGNWLWARGTLPAKPYSAKTGTFQQRFALSCPFTPQGIRHAEKLVQQAGAQLSLGRFNWLDWIKDPALNPQSAVDWVKRFEADYWLRRTRSPSAENNWAIYRQVFNKLPAGQPLTVELMIEVIGQTKPDTRARQRTVMVLSKLAELAGFPVEMLKMLAGKYSPKSVEPRSLPTDSEIVAMVDSIQCAGWRWVAAMQATYGLRNHEVFHLNLLDFPTVWVEDPTKTGKRFVYPVHADWTDRWNLSSRNLPSLKELSKDNKFAWNNTLLGTKVSKWFAAHMTCKPYDLRHSYARRCFEQGFPADLTAKLMGHSLQVQLNTYRAWWSESTYRKMYEAAIATSKKN